MATGYEKAALLLVLTAVAAILTWLSFKFSIKNSALRIISFSLAIIIIMVVFNVAFTFAFDDYPQISQIFWLLDVVFMLLFAVYLLYRTVGYAIDTYSAGKINEQY